MSGWEVEKHKVNDPGVDVKATKEKKMMVVECWNWAKSSYPTLEKMKSVLNNLDHYPKAKRILVTCFKTDFGNFKKELERRKVTVIRLGEQIGINSHYALKLIFQKLRHLLYSIEELMSTLSTKKEEEGYKVRIFLFHLKSFGYGKSEFSVKEKLNRLKGIVLGIQTSDSMRKDRRRVRCPICMHGEVTSLPWVTMFHDKKDLN